MRKDSSTKRIKARNWNAVSAILRNAGPMKDRRAPRGGSSNESRDLIYEAQDEINDAIHDAAMLNYDHCEKSCCEGVEK